MIQPLWKTVWTFLKRKQGIKSPYDLAIPLLGIYPEETKTEKDTCTPAFTVALFTVVNARKKTQISVDSLIDKEAVVHIYNGILLSHK